MADHPNTKPHMQLLASGSQGRISDLHRFALLLVGSFGTICGSFGYAFTLVLPRMQERYNLSQRDLASVTTVGLVFGFFMLPFGALYDYFGPLPVAILSMISYPLGAVLTALCFEGLIEGSTVRLCVFNAFQSVGMSLTDIVCCMTVLSYFPSNRGPVIALLKTFPGLGSAIVGSFFAGFFHEKVSDYLFFLAVFAFLTNTTCALVMRLPAYHLTGYQESHLSEEAKERLLATKTRYLKQAPPMWRFILGFIILMLFIVYLPTTSALVAYLSLSRTHKLGFASGTAVLVGMYMLIAVPLPACLRRQLTCRKSRNVSDNDETCESRANGCHSPDREPFCTDADADASAQKAALTLTEETLEGDGQRAAHVPTETDVDYLAPQYQGTFLQNLCTLELWALWWTLLCVFGAEFVIIYNATFILGALQGSAPVTSLTALLTVLNGVGSAVGRLMMSFFEVWSQKRKAEDRVPITIALFFPTSTIITSIIMFLTLPAAALPLPYVIAALGNGFCAASQILVARTIFAKDPAKHYHFCFSATMVASVLLNRFLYGEWYTVQAEKQGSRRCFGKHCVMMPLLVMLGLATSAFITDVIVHLRYRSYCRRVLVERARLHGEVADVEKQRAAVAEEVVCESDVALDTENKPRGA
ncbi:putative Major Facilitator Superfamily/Nodulin-like [Leishmania utingensis]|uniref:Major Facilitator Superfamily/Nodulin-like n=1 Tax=Leishmania utingensis TaxID=653362 RepID=A0AAW3B0F9_9TRYP